MDSGDIFLKTHTSPVSTFPEGVANGNWFSFYNAVSFQIFLGPPIVLYAKSLGASATLLGVLASLTPLLTIFQIPAAHYLERFGYRRFILAGWGTRNLCVFSVVAIPWLDFLSNGWKLGLLLGFLFIFNLLRGITSGAWLPWLTELLPEEIRASYLSRDQRFLQTGSLAALLFCGLILQKDSRAWEFSAIFLLSAVSGAISLFYLNRMPEARATEAHRRSATSVPWKAIVTYPPFFRLVGFNLLTSFTFGSLGVFTVSFLKGRSGLGENQILFLMAMTYVAGVGSLGVVGGLLDRFGSKRLLHGGLCLHGAFIAGWAVLALGLVAPGIGPLALIFVLAGVGGSAFNLANTRLTMSVMPEMGRAHFFAFYSVITSLCLGFTPILWGVALDAMDPLNAATGPLQWNRYSVYFVTLLALTFTAFFAVASLIDKRPKPGAVK